MQTDQKTLDRITLLHPIVRDEVMEIYLNQIVPSLIGGAFCRFAYTLRTFAEQDALYAQGRTKLFDNNGNRLGKVTNAKGGQSIHCYGLALDIVLIDGNNASWDTVKDFDGDGKSDWMEVVNIFKANNWEWGGDFISITDKPHFQKTFDYGWEDLLAKYNNGDFIEGTNYVNI
jgi:peptidoglycan L-alanyl-D-glutamate endopeptidase CwlK